MLRSGLIETRRLYNPCTPSYYIETTLPMLTGTRWMRHILPAIRGEVGMLVRLRITIASRVSCSCSTTPKHELPLGKGQLSFEERTSLPDSGSVQILWRCRG